MTRQEILTNENTRLLHSTICMRFMGNNICRFDAMIDMVLFSKENSAFFTLCRAVNHLNAGNLNTIRNNFEPEIKENSGFAGKNPFIKNISTEISVEYFHNLLNQNFERGKMPTDLW